LTHHQTSRLVLVRHGRTAWNEQGLYQGHADIPLDPVGEQQAAELVPSLAPLGPDLIATSDLSRARQTGAPLAAAVGLTPVVDPRLREVDVGRWEGLTREQAATAYPEEFRRWMGGEDVARGGGETRRDAAARAVDGILDHLRAAGPGALVVIVSHGMVLSATVEALAALGVINHSGPVPRFANAAWMDLIATLPELDELAEEAEAAEG